MDAWAHSGKLSWGVYASFASIFQFPSAVSKRKSDAGAGSQYNGPRNPVVLNAHVEPTLAPSPQARALTLAIGALVALFGGRMYQLARCLVSFAAWEDQAALSASRCARCSGEHKHVSIAPLRLTFYANLSAIAEHSPPCPGLLLQPKSTLPEGCMQHTSTDQNQPLSGCKPRAACKGEP